MWMAQAVANDRSTSNFEGVYPMMNKTTWIAMAALALISGASLMTANAATSGDDVKAVAENAAALVWEQGNLAFPKISDPNGSFHRGNVYVAVLDRQGIVRATPNAKLIGVSMWDASDIYGSVEALPKQAWIYRVGDYMVVSGVMAHDVNE